MSQHLAIVRDKRPQMLDRPGWARTMEKYEGKQIRLTVSGGEKTLSQLGYYHSTVLPEFAEQYGEDDLRVMHLVLKDMFLQKIETTNKLTGEILFAVPSLADVSVEEMSEFLDKVLRQAALNGWHISPPRGK